MLRRRDSEAPKVACERPSSELPAAALPPFVGRVDEREVLHAGFRDSRVGHTRMVLVGGVSGVGKTALLDRFVHELGPSALVFRGRCYEREALPYKVFDPVLQAIGDYLETLPTFEARALLPPDIAALLRLFPELGRVSALRAVAPGSESALDARQLRNQAFAALRQFLLRLSLNAPIVLVVDDLQWGDIDSARMLSHVFGPSEAPPLLFVGAYRSDERVSSPFVRELIDGELLRSGTAQLVELAPLPHAAALQLAHTLLSRDGLPADARVAEAVAGEADGMPFFIAELVQHWRTRGTFAEAAGSEPITLERALAQRVAALTESDQRLLRVLSVVAGPIAQSVALEAADLARNEHASLQRLRSARLIRSRGGAPSDPAETYHDRVRESVLRELPEALLRQTHARIADALVSHGVSDPDRLAVHYAGAGDRGKTASCIEQAAHGAAQKLAFNRAADLFERAIELTDQPSRKRELARAMADALANAGRGVQSAQAYLAAAAGREPGEARKLERLAVQQYLRAGQLELGIPLTKRLLKECGIRYPESDRSALLGLLLESLRLRFVRIETGQPSRPPPAAAHADRLETLGAIFRELSSICALPGRLMQLRFLRESLAHGDDTHVLRALTTHALLMALFDGEAAQTRVEAYLAVIDDLAARLATPYAEATAALARGASELALGRFGRVEALCARAEHIFRNECQGTHWDAIFTHLWRYAAIELGGDLSILLREAPENERDARERDDEYTLASLMVVVPQAHMMQDDPQGALRHLEAQAARLSKDEFQTFDLWVMDRTTDAYLYSGQGRRAWNYLQQMWPRFARSYLVRAPLMHVNAHFLLGRTAIAALCEQPGDRTLERSVRKAVRSLRRHRRPDAIGYAHLLEAGLAQRCGESRHARVSLERAIDTFGRGGLGNFARYAQYNLGIMAGPDAPERSLAAEADAALAAMGIRDRSRWVATYAPGFS